MPVDVGGCHTIATAAISVAIRLMKDKSDGG
jgi:hypothetical protein